MTHERPLSLAKTIISVVLVSGTVLLFSIAFGSFFFVRAQQIMEQALKTRLMNIAASSALAFRDTNLEQIRGPEDVDTPVYADAIAILNSIRNQNPGLKFTYIFRPTKDPNVFEFVADADSLHPYDKVDLNGDGAIDDSDALAPPGTPYDVSRLASIHEALKVPVTTDAPYTDQWGTYMSGFAPIRDRRGVFKGILGTDMDIANYTVLSQSIFSPVAFLLFVLTGAAIAGFIAIIIWKRRLESFSMLESERAALLQLTFHQLGTPLTIIRLATESLHTAVVPHAKACPGALKDIISLRDGADRIDSILKSLSGADQVHHGNVEYTFAATPLQSVIHDVVHDLHDILERKHQKLLVSDVPDVSVNIDPTRIGAVLREIVGNASDFSAKGSPIAIRTSVKGNFVHIVVKDEGCGVPSHEISRMFEEFTRASNAAIHKPNGNGLGLYIAKGIIEKAGGTISLKSKVSEGTTVEFTLPLR